MTSEERVGTGATIRESGGGDGPREGDDEQDLLHSSGKLG